MCKVCSVGTWQLPRCGVSIWRQEGAAWGSRNTVSEMLAPVKSQDKYLTPGKEREVSESSIRVSKEKSRQKWGPPRPEGRSSLPSSEQRLF